jgi:hypothetical protein
MNIGRLTVLLTMVGFAWSQTAQALPVDLTTGTTGTQFLSQSFNETRAVDVFVLGISDLSVTQMTLRHFQIGLPGDPSDFAGARIYTSGGSLLAGTNQTVPTGADQTVAIPMSATLLAGQTYRVGFFLSAPPNRGSAAEFDPDPSNSIAMNYVDATGTFRITGAFSSIQDAYPTIGNQFVPYITLDLEPVPEPSTFALMLTGLGLLGVMAHRRLRRTAEPANISSVAA